MEKKRSSGVIFSLKKGTIRALAYNLIIAAFCILVIVIDTLWSTRTGYADFQWSTLHDFANFSLGIFISPANTNNDFAVFAIVWLAATALAYVFTYRKIDAAKARSVFIFAFAVTYPLWNLFVGTATLFVRFTISVFKFEFV